MVRSPSDEVKVLLGELMEAERKGKLSIMLSRVLT